MWSRRGKQKRTESWMEVLSASAFFTRLQQSCVSDVKIRSWWLFQTRQQDLLLWRLLTPSRRGRERFFWLQFYCFLLSGRLNILNRHDQSECVRLCVCACVCVCVGHTGWAWQTLATSSQEAPYSMARAASLIISPAPWRRKDKCVEHVFFCSHSNYVCDCLLVLQCKKVKDITV